MFKGTISLVFAYKVTIFIGLSHKTEFKVTICLVFVFKITMFIRLSHKLFNVMIDQNNCPSPISQHLSEIEIHKFPFQT